MRLKSNIQGSTVVKRHTAWASVTCLAIGLEIFAIDGFCENTGAGGFTYSPWAAKKKGMRKGVVKNGIFKRSGDVLLSHHGCKILWPVFAGRNDKFFHCNKSREMNLKEKWRVDKLPPVFRTGLTAGREL